MEYINFDLPGMDLRIKLNSSEVCTTDKLEEFQLTVAKLVNDVVHDKFSLTTEVIEENSFSISITGLPDPTSKAYLVKIDVGLLKMIYDGLYVVLSNNNVFAGFGMSFGTFNIPTINVPNWNSLDIAMSVNDEVYFDANRTNLHSFRYNLCLSFILRHEIRHIANGHIDYLTDVLHPLFFENSKNGLSPLDSQTLEMDVDSCVFAGIIEGMMADPAQREMVPDLIRNEQGIFSSLLFSLQFLFYCLPSKKASNITVARSLSHPNSYLRYFYCFTSGLSFMQERYPQYVDLFGNTHRDNFWTFINNLAEQGILNFDLVKQDYDWSMSDEGFDYANEIWNNWDNWIPKLRPHTYLELAPSNSNL